MADGDVTVTNQLTKDLIDAWFTGTFKMALVNTTFNKDTHNHWSDISASEIAASGYTAGGATVANLATSRNDVNDRTEIDFDPVQWTNLATATISHAILYKDTGTPSTSTIVMAIEAPNSNGNNYQISPPASGGLHLLS